MPRTRTALALLVALGAVAAASADGPQAAQPDSFSKEQREHWSFRKRMNPTPPEVKESAWVRNPIDRFVLAGLEELEFRHAPEADRVALIRRVTYDLTGLPPTPEAVAAFLADTRPDAFERVVDRLLDSAEYGERWAQHWLDLAHYADSNGFELDAERPDAWRYRDWVVRALNADMPYDRFLLLQLAGDELEPGSHEALIATGFGRCGPREVVGGNIDPEVRRQSELTEVTTTVGSVFLGLTMGCARCHDHKFDPLPMTDYYGLQAYFAASQLVDRDIADKSEQESHAAAEKAINEKCAPLKARLAELEAPFRAELRKRKETMLTAAERSVMNTPEKDRTPEQKKLAEGLNKALNVTWEEVAAAVKADPAKHLERERLKRAIHEIQITGPRPPAKAMALADEGKDAPETFVLKRGDVKVKGPKVEPHPPAILAVALGEESPPQIAPTASTTGRRLALARWLTRPDHPLTARVIVNRLWLAHFGRGLAATPSDFGVRGESPSHPELLDWLAGEFVAAGWRFKPLHRLMVTSATYRQSSSWKTAKQADEDPENVWLWRMNRRRLDAEGLRDAMLAVSGELNPAMGGPGVLVPIEKEIEDLIFTEAEVVDLWPETPDPREYGRRSLYLFRKRNVRYPMFDAFDAPDTQSACPQRHVSTHALQSLVLLNSDFAADRAKALAGRVLREAADTPGRIDRLYRICLARPPAADEFSKLEAFLASQADFLRARPADSLAKPRGAPADLDPALGAAWVDLARAMINRNEFVYVP